MKFVAFPRELQGTGASRRLRLTGKVPGIVYGAGEPAMIELDHNALFHALKKEAFHSSVLEMELNGAVTKVVLRDVQKHAYKPLIQHIDFQRVDATTRIHKRVPLHFINEAESQAVKFDKCLINHVISDLEIECLAEKLPEFLTVDLGGMAKGQSLHVDDLKLDASIKVVTHGRKNPLVAVVVPIVEEEIVVAAAPVAAKGKGGKGKKDEKQNKK
ncbi:MAG TPA: 50S ribosomal protein L25/general stress protein Ctc [Burkholderiaceae bacterium]|nr:50S ribosomal protein L25/general stress protein Ctc [Burkholderiaceae bacterium]HMX10589.1 50S ribosomal protein L25/general stress protein Ctc [Burkholderiaceae bacterium]HMY99845.1 50S ribosomal protein L25/general stress protein Ctc [Burkholderiaceae bacterium]HNG77888.1 50S ribosomal protein L25/general stress protein Ctc [Burkholderiaceae bacterium]